MYVVSRFDLPSFTKKVSFSSLFLDFTSCKYQSVSVRTMYLMYVQYIRTYVRSAPFSKIASQRTQESPPKRVCTYLRQRERKIRRWNRQTVSRPCNKLLPRINDVSPLSSKDTNRLPSIFRKILTRVHDAQTAAAKVSSRICHDNLRSVDLPSTFLLFWKRARRSRSPRTSGRTRVNKPLREEWNERSKLDRR